MKIAILLICLIGISLQAAAQRIDTDGPGFGCDNHATRSLRNKRSAAPFEATENRSSGRWSCLSCVKRMLNPNWRDIVCTPLPSDSEDECNQNLFDLPDDSSPLESCVFLGFCPTFSIPL